MPVAYLTGSNTFRQPVASRAAMAALLDKVHTYIVISIYITPYIEYAYTVGESPVAHLGL